MNDLDDDMRWLAVTMQAFATNHSKLTAAEGSYALDCIGLRVFAWLAKVNPQQARAIYRRETGFGALH